LRFERFSNGRTKEGQKVYPQFEGISIKIYMPEYALYLDFYYNHYREVKTASLTSMPEGTFSFD
jgi:hypothetical protein